MCIEWAEIVRKLEKNPEFASKILKIPKISLMCNYSIIHKIEKNPEFTSKILKIPKKSLKCTLKL